MISSDPDETLADLRACFSRATALDGMVERSFTISGYQVRLRFRGQELVSETADAFAHLPETSGHEELVLNSWIADAPELLPALRPHMVNHPAAIAELRLGRPEIRAHHNGGTGLTVVYDPSSGEAWRWMRPGSPLPWWERAAPMRAVLYWFLEQHQRTFLHGAAVSDGRAAAMLVGPGGSGKSSTALACLLAGMDYLGDDYCVASLDDLPRVYCLYGTAKVRPEGIAGFEGLLADASPSGDAEDEKLVVWPSRTFPTRIADSAPIATVIAPVVRGVGATRVTRISPAQALAALAPSSILQIPGAGESALAQMAGIVRTVPCWQLELGADRAAVPDVVRQTLEQSALVAP